MEQEILPCFHRILVIPKLRQKVRDEVLQGFQRVFPRHGPVERLQITEMIGKVLPDQRHHIACCGVRNEATAGRYWKVPGQFLAILRVIVPTTALGLVTVHEPAGLAPHVTVEVLQPKALASLRPVCEFGSRAQKPIIFTKFNFLDRNSCGWSRLSVVKNQRAAQRPRAKLPGGSGQCD